MVCNGQQRAFAVTIKENLGALRRLSIGGGINNGETPGEIKSVTGACRGRTGE